MMEFEIGKRALQEDSSQRVFYIESERTKERQRERERDRVRERKRERKKKKEETYTHRENEISVRGLVCALRSPSAHWT